MFLKNNNKGSCEKPKLDGNANWINVKSELLGTLNVRCLCTSCTRLIQQTAFDKHTIPSNRFLLNQGTDESQELLLTLEFPLASLKNWSSVESKCGGK
ncbi:hypothetical protein CEXT_236531 [Caerostris extrusa]|uniref:Uncharacterized protein n=1 Tax=Caerostris extrusa TaxID=172846 RepID=A0AAV4U6N2_CAEEX|nr:hypothetical protein CEXT_236531 [Caerostris extrusa]